VKVFAAMPTRATPAEIHVGVDPSAVVFRRQPPSRLTTMAPRLRRREQVALHTDHAEVLAWRVARASIGLAERRVVGLMFIAPSVQAPVRPVSLPPARIGTSRPSSSPMRRL
jgi:hypothetical protein